MAEVSPVVQDFYENVLLPRYRLVNDHLADVNNEERGKDINRVHAEYKKMRVLEQQVVVLCDMLYDHPSVLIEPETDRRFMVWLAEQRICVDSPQVPALRDAYIKV